MPDGYSWMAIAVPAFDEPLEFTRENFDTIIDIFVEILTPTLSLYALSKPPQDLMHPVMEAVVAAQVSFFLTARHSVVGGPPPEFMNDQDFMRDFIETLMAAMWARLDIVVHEILAQVGNDDD